MPLTTWLRSGKPHGSLRNAPNFRPTLAMPSVRRGRRNGSLMTHRPRVEVLEDRLAPATHIWTGASTVSALWSDAANWSGGAPSPGESSVALIFPSALQTVNFNDLTGLTVASIQFTAANYVLDGNAITLTGDTTITAANASGQNTIDVALNQQPFVGGTLAFFDHVYDVAGGGTLTVASQISGDPLLNSLHKTGAGTLVLDSSNNNYGGTTQIDAGTLAQGVDNATPPNPCTVAQGAVFDTGGFNASLGSLSGGGTVSAPLSPIFCTVTTGLDNSDTTFSGTITGPINLVKAGTGAFTLAAVSTYTGSTTIQAGTLAQGVDNATPPSPCIVAQGAVFDTGGFNASLGSLSGGGTVSAPLSPIFCTVTTGLDNSDTTFSGTITGPINLVKAGTGSFTLAAVSTYTGSTNIQAGTLAQGIDNATPPNPCIVAQGATFALAGFDASLGSLAGAGAVSLGLDPPTLTTGADNTSTTFSGVISGPGNLTKIGTGTLLLSGVNTYTGNTSVLGGTLQVTGTLSASTSVSVAPGASLTGTAVIGSATVLGTNGNDTFTIDTTGVTLDGTVIVATPYTALTVDGVGGNDKFDVLGTNAGSSTILNAVSGVNLFNVGSAANMLDPIQGAVTINGNGALATLNVYDQGTSSTQSYSVSASQITRSPASADPSPTQTINYFNMGSVNVYGGTGADGYNALGTAAGTSTALYAKGQSENEFTVENAVNLLHDIQGPLALHGDGLDLLTADDNGDTVGHTYTLTAGMLQRDGIANITYDGMGEFVLGAANNVGHSSNTVYVQSMGNVFAFVEVGTGDVVTVGQNGSMAGIVGDLRIQDVLGQVPRQITLDDSADIAGRTVTLGGDPFFGYLVSGLEPNASPGRGRIGLLLDPATPVSIRTGAGNDVFRIQDFTGAPALSLFAGGGTNSLDYSAYKGAVQVVLRLGVATGVAGGINNIENVTGGQGNNLLVGDANPNVLIGGTGRNVIIGGQGADTLDASAATSDNILIGGTTGYDTNLAALDAIFAEWTRTDLSFKDRYSDLTTGSNGQGATPLNEVNGQLILLTNTTVHADNSPDVLIGSNQTDPATGKRAHNWFFYDADDTLVNFLSSSDHETKVK